MRRQWARRATSVPGPRAALAGLVAVILVGTVLGPVPWFGVSANALASGLAALQAPTGARGLGAPSPLTGSAQLSFGQWSNLTSSSGAPPSPRADYGMAYDPLLGGVVLYGGVTSAESPLGDTWEFTAAGWHNLTPSLSPAPPARWGAGMVYDPALHALLLFGGHFATGALNTLNDTWEFTGAGWTELHPAVSPPPMDGLFMVYDSTDGYPFLWGFTEEGAPYSYWTFEGGAWENITSASTGTLPPVNFYGANDPQVGGVLFYGGFPYPGYPICSGGLTYTYSHGVFTNLTPTESSEPAAVMGSGVMAYVPPEQGVVLFSGYTASCTLSNATWAFRDGAWVNLTAQIGPPPPGRWDARFVYDPLLNGAVTFGGNENQFAGADQFGNDTWEYRVGESHVFCNLNWGNGSCSVHPHGKCTPWPALRLFRPFGRLGWGGLGRRPWRVCLP